MVAVVAINNQIEVTLDEFAEVVMANLVVSMATMVAVMFGGTVLIVSAFSRKGQGQGKGKGKGKGVTEGIVVAEGLVEDEDENDDEGDGEEDVGLDADDHDKEESKGGDDAGSPWVDNHDGKEVTKRAGRKESKLGQEDEEEEDE